MPMVMMTMLKCKNGGDGVEWLESKEATEEERGQEKDRYSSQL